MNEFVETLIERVNEAEMEAFKKGIETNAIILNANNDFCRELYVGSTVYPPQILGKKVFIGTFLPDKYDFSLTWSNLAELQENELDKLKRLIRKYVKCDGESLRFKGLSYKKNKEDYEYLKGLLEDED